MRRVVVAVGIKGRGLHSRGRFAAITAMAEERLGWEDDGCDA